MSMTLIDTLPQDAGSQKFMALVDSDTGDFVLLRAVNVETIDSLDYGDIGIALRPADGTTTQTHAGVSVTTSENVGTEIASGGYSKAAAFVSVGAGADIRVRVYGRLTTGGDNYTLTLLTDGQQASTKQVYLFDLAAPFLAIGLQAVSGSATCSCSVYLLP